MDKKERQRLERYALQIRIGIIEQLTARGFGHAGGSLSIAETLAVLYGAVMDTDAANPKRPDRDKLVCSKGHAGPAVYAALAARGFFPYEKLRTLNQPNTDLPSHCDRSRTPGIDMTTGSLGQGTSLAVGLALGDQLKGRKNRVFLIVGDGELDEGQVWEAAMFTAAKRVHNLVWLIDQNKKQLDGTTEEILDTFDLAEKFQAFGFDVSTVNGHDVEALVNALEKPAAGKPRAIILDTVKGKGVREIEGMASNHSINVTAEQGKRWLAELQEELAALEG